MFYISKYYLTRIQTITEMLINRRDMLDAYFCLRITEDGVVETLPLLLKDYMPDLNLLPRFLMRLGPQVRPALTPTIKAHLPRDR